MKKRSQGGVRPIGSMTKICGAAYQAARVALSDADQDVRSAKAECEASNYGEAEYTRFSAMESRAQHAQRTVVATAAYDAAEQRERAREHAVETTTVPSQIKAFAREIAESASIAFLLTFLVGYSIFGVVLWLTICLVIYGVIVIVFVSHSVSSCRSRRLASPP
jgi:hypothetical protein